MADRRSNFTTTPSKIALEHQEEVFGLVAEGIAAARRRELAVYRNQDGNSQGYDRVPAEVRGLI